MFVITAKDKKGVKSMTDLLTTNIKSRLYEGNVYYFNNFNNALFTKIVY